MPEHRRLKPKKKNPIGLRPKRVVGVSKLPEVIVDFVFENGLFFISIQNIGTGSAQNISIKFDKHFKGLNGLTEISTLPVFRSIGFMPPGKEIRLFLDKSDAYFKRKEPETVSMKIHYQDRKGKSYSESITHHLGIYKNLPYTEPIQGG